MRVLHIDTERTWRGGENQLALLIRGLKAKGISSFLVGKRDSTLQERREEFAIEEAYFLPLRGELDFGSAKKIASLIDLHEISIVHCHTSHAHTLGFIAKVLSRKKPKVLVTRRVDFDIYKKGSARPLTFLKYRFMADHYIAISQKIRKVLIEGGVPPEKVSLVYSGVDPRRTAKGDGQRLKVEFGIREGEVVLGNISHFAEHKAHEDLLRALRIVLDRGYRARLFIAGKGEREPYLRTLASTLGLNDTVTFLGFRDDIGDLLAFFDLFVVSSREEGLCTSIIDAFFAGCPVVATDAGGIPELVEDGSTGLLRKTADPLSLAEGIIYAMENPELMKAMAEKAKHRAYENFTAEKMAAGNLKVYQKLLTRLRS